MPSFDDFSSIIDQARSQVSQRLGGLFEQSLGGSRSGLGLDIGHRRIKIAKLEVQGKGRAVSQLIDEPVSTHLTRQGVFSDPEGLADEIAQILETKGLQRAEGCIMIGGQDVMIRTIKMDRMDKEQALRALPNTDHLPMKLSPQEFQFDLVILDPESSTNKMKTVVVAAKKNAVRLRQEAALEAGLHVQAVDVDALALYNLFEYCHPERVAQGTTMIANIGYHGAFLIGAHNGELLLARNLRTGGVEKLLQSISGGGMMSMDETEEQLFNGKPSVIYPDAFGNWKSKVLQEVQRSLEYMARRATGEQELKLFLCGGGALIPGINEDFAEQLNRQVQTFDPLQNLPSTEDFESGSGYAGTAHAISLGLALRQTL